LHSRITFNTRFFSTADPGKVFFGPFVDYPSAGLQVYGGVNSRNGYNRNTLKGDHGEIEIGTPRDRNGSFEPVFVAKNQTRLGMFDDEILLPYAKGMTTRDIVGTFAELYGAASETCLSPLSGLTGFPEAIAAVFPKTQVQLCIVHRMRNSPDSLMISRVIISSFA
jgi:transposase-like protein